jgi:hypothetical protein
MLQFLKEKIEKLEDISTAISNQIENIKSTPENVLPTRFITLNDELHTLIVRLYSQLGIYHRDVATLFGAPNAFPASSSGLTEIQKMNNDYIKIKMPIPYRKDKNDPILASDLDAALWEAQKNGTKIPYMEQMEIVFTFCYSSDTNKSLIRDNDNYALKPIINTIVRHMRNSDRGDKTWLSLRTIVKENIENQTLIEVKKKAHLEPLSEDFLVTSSANLTFCNA